MSAGQIKQQLENESALLRKFGADQKYNTPKSYRKSGSHFGDGKYPPDWTLRRRAIWWLQDDQCGRCGRKTSNNGHVHHIKPLADGGNNRLKNLVGLCNDCHALLHPEVRELNGNWKAAPKFPCEHAEKEVAVIKRPNIGFDTDENSGIELDLEKLDAETHSKRYIHAIQSPAVYDISPTIARQLSQAGNHTDEQNCVLKELSRLLLLHGRVPKNDLHSSRELNINISLEGILGWFSSFTPDIDVEVSETSATKGPVKKVAKEIEEDNTYDKKILFSENVTEVTVTIVDGNGEIIQQQVTFTDRNNTQSVSISISPPSLSMSTIGSYLWNSG